MHDDRDYVRVSEVAVHWQLLHLQRKASLNAVLYAQPCASDHRTVSASTLKTLHSTLATSTDLSVSRPYTHVTP